MIRDELVAEEDLVEAVKTALERKGVAAQVKSQIRAEVFHTLEDKTVELPDKPPDVFLASELIREFLIKLNLRNTLSVFCEEMGQQGQMDVDRELVSAELGINTLESDTNIPLLIQLVQHMGKSKENILQSSMSVEPDSELS